jgi:2-oxoisovalerate dehydrogenase E2 component (dihydrolipoyl transacylase)
MCAGSVLLTTERATSVPDFLLPDLGEGLEEAEVLSWRVQVGDQVTVDQIVVEVETAKAAVEVPVPFAGTVSALHAAAGTTVSVGQPLISVDELSVDELSVDQADEDSGNVLVGYGTAALSSPTASRRRRAGRDGGRNGGRDGGRNGSGPVPVVSPLVRRMARQAGLDLATVRGTGPGGIVLRRDVDRELVARGEPLAPAVKAVQGAQPATPPATAPGAQPAAPPATAPPATGARVPLRGARKAMADKLTRSRREIPEATVWVDVDATDLVAARAALNARDPQRPVGLLALLARFTVLALRSYPELNARLERDEIVIPDHVHLGFAAQTERGLVVPVIRDAHRLSTRDLSAALAERTDAARAGRLTPAELTGGTITVNNYGVFGVDGSAAIINHPEVAIVGFGRIIDRPWVVDGQVVVRKITELTLSFDHRVCDGGTAGGFLRYLADCVERPVTALGDL